MYFIKRKTLVSILIVAMVFSFLPASGSFQVVSAAEIHTDYLDSGSLEMEKLSKEEIIDLLADSPTDMPDETEEIFDENPSVEAPYAPGKVKQELLQQTVDRLNALRRIAGLPDVVLDSSLCNQAQYGAVLLAVSEFSHYPSKPEDMNDGFYSWGYNATSSSNIYAGRRLTLTPDGFMDDSDAKNVDRVGHRRWQLNPSLGKIGFGYVLSPASQYERYTAEKVHDQSGGPVDYDYISWPASGYFPKELFNDNTAWSVTLNPSMYMTPKRNDLTVTLTRMSDEQSWTFNGADTYTQASSGSYFNVELSGYGVSNCIIFRPEGVSEYEGVYTVTIDGLKDKSGNPTAFSFQTDFFKAVPEELNRFMFSVDTDDEIYDGGAKSKTITSSLTENKDYTVTYTSNVDVGTASITITGTGMYYGELNYWFRIRDAFDDVTNKDYFYNAVTWAVNHDPQITKGTSDTTFGPAAPCTRGQAVTFLWRACGCEKVTDVENPFTDVKASDYYYDAVLWAYKNKITTGTTATTFGPNETCNRGQIVTFLWRSQGEPMAIASIGFNDVASDAYCYAPVRWAVEKGITKGTTDKTFSPNDSCTRGQIVTFLYRAVDVNSSGNENGDILLPEIE